MKKILFLLFAILSFAACDSEDTIINVINGGSNGTTVAKANSCSLIVNVGDADYGTVTRTVVDDDAVRATETLVNTEIALYDATNGWTIYQNLTDSKPFVNEGSTRGYVYSETDLENPYASETEWDVDHTISAGSLTLTAKKVGSLGYYAPIPVTFWGNYGLACFNTNKTTYTENESCDGTSVTSDTKTVAIDHNIQYATSVFMPKITVGDTDGKIQVYSNNKGDDWANVDRDDFKFSIQYVYVQSAEKVKYTTNFDYDATADLVTYKYALVKNGIFGNVSGSSDVFESWDNNYSNLSILPTSKTSVRVVLVCYYMGDNSSTYIYNASKGYYQKLVKGARFYVYGKLTTSSTNTVTNTGNALCTEKYGNGSKGVFIADVKTTAEITIDKLATDKDGDGTNDPVVIDPSSDDIINYNILFTADVDYGDMKAKWDLGK